MEVILIACSGSKTEGGSPNYNGSSLSSLLPVGSVRYLMAARLELAGMVDEIPGPDFGGVSPGRKAFLPALERYSGKVYERSQVRNIYPKTKELNILIISALYGLLDAYEPIRLYNHEMKDTTKHGTRLYTWWKAKRLGKLVEEAVFALEPNRVHCLLPQNYLKALMPLSAETFNRRGIECKTYEHPGQGIGILNKWGEDLEGILLEHL